MTVYAVTWERDGVRYLIDIDDAGEAYRLAVAIAESGRGDVRVTRYEADVPDEVIEAARRRVAERLRAEGVMQ